MAFPSGEAEQEYGTRTHGDIEVRVQLESFPKSNTITFLFWHYSDISSLLAWSTGQTNRKIFIVVF